MGKPTSTRNPKVGVRERRSASKILIVGAVSFPAPLPPACDLDLKGTGTVRGRQAACFLEEVSAPICTRGHEGAPRFSSWRGRLPGGGRLFRAVRVRLPVAPRPPHNGAREVGLPRGGKCREGKEFAEVCVRGEFLPPLHVPRTV